MVCMPIQSGDTWLNDTVRRRGGSLFINSIIHALIMTLFGTLQIPLFVKHKGKDLNSDWLVGEWDE